MDGSRPEDAGPSTGWGGWGRRAGRSPRRQWMLKMAWRETRGAWRHVAHVLACIILGVAALVAVGSFGDSVRRTIAGSARSLTGGDLEIRGPRALPPEAAQAVAELGAARRGRGPRARAVRDGLRLRGGRRARARCWWS